MRLRNVIPIIALTFILFGAFVCSGAIGPHLDCHDGQAAHDGAPAQDLVFIGTVTKIYPVASAYSQRRWAVVAQIDRVISGEFSGTTFTFTVHSPSRMGLQVGRAYTITAKRNAAGYLVDDTQWFKPVASQAKAPKNHADANGFQKSKPEKLYLVKKIYLGEIQLVIVDDPFKAYLKRELEAKGFSVVDDVANADAILRGTMAVPLVEDDWPGYTVLYDVLKFSLDSPTKENIWRGKIQIESKQDIGKNVEKRARKLAERIEKDWKKSAKNAGIKQ